MGRKSTTRAYLVLLALSILSSFAYFASAAPTQTSTSWSDSFTDQTGIAALSNLNFSAGNLSLNNSPWYYPNHDYRKQITINGSTSNLTDYQIPINITIALYNNTGLVGSWHFNDGSGNRTADSSGFGNDGTMYGNMNTTLDANLTSGWVSAGKFGNALAFDGVNDYVNITNSASLSTNNPAGYSAILWVKQVSATGSGGQTYLSKSSTNGFTFRSTVGASSPELLINEGSGCTLTSTSSFSLNTWHQVGFTYSSSGTVIIFLDGSPDKNTATCGTMSDGGTALVIGDDSHNPGRPFNGTIDEVRIYNRSLSPTEISEQYQAGKARLDYQDLRFTWVNSTSNAEQNISYWLENDNQAWVKAPDVTASTVANTTLYMYYGNPTATYNNSLGGNSTFSFFDDFSYSDSVTNHQWSLGGGVYSGNPSPSNGIVTLSAPSPSTEIYNNVLRNGVNLYWYGSFSSTSDNSWGGWNGAGGLQGNYEYGVLRSPAGTTSAFEFSSIAGETGETIDLGSPDPSDNNFHKFYITWNGSTMKLFIDGTLRATSAYSRTANRFIDFLVAAGSQKIDYVFINNYASPEPSVLSVGSEQRKPRSGSAGSVQITPPSSFLQWQNFSADSLLGWQYKKEINISNVAGNLTNYQVNVLLINGTNFNSSKAKANGDDIRFTAPLSYSGGGKWLYKKEINISNRINPTTLTDYQVLISLEGVGGTGYNFDFSKAKSDGSDIRFYDPDTKSELSYWVESWNSTTLKANVWVKIPSIAGNSDKRVWMWYGNSLATAASNGNNTFTFFDDFSGDLSKWTLTQSSAGNVQSVSGEARLTGSAAWEANGMTSIANINRPVIIEWKSRASPNTDDYEGYGVQPIDSTGLGLTWGRAGNDCLYRNLAGSGSLTCTFGYITQTTQTPQKIILPGVGYEIYWNNILKETNAVWTVDGKKLVFQIHSGSAKYLYIDDTRVRKYASPEPNITVSSSELSINSSYVEIPYWIESWNSSANSSLWAKVPFLQNGTNTTVYMYYGNAEASSASNGNSVFDFFDDFSGDLSKWTTAGTVSIASGELRFYGAGNWNTGAKSNQNFTSPLVLEFSRRVDNTAPEFVGGLNDAIEISTSYGLGLVFGGSTTAYNRQVESSTLDVGDFATGTTYQEKFVVKSSGYDLYRDNQLLESNTAWIQGGNTTIVFTKYSANYGYADNVRVRKYASPEPNATVSTTDTSGDFSAGVADINYKIMRNAGLADWKYRKAITINGSTSNLTDYQIPINLTTAIYNNTGLVGSWHFNDGTGNRTADSSGFGNDGTCYGSEGVCNWTTGKFGNALKFDGVDDYVNVSNSTILNPTNALTLIAWIKLGTIANATILSKNQSYELSTNSTGNVLFTVNSTTVTGSTSLSSGTWYHIAAVYNTTNISVFVNAVSDGIAGYSSGIPANQLFLLIGSNSSLGRYFNGIIDEVRIYNRSLSATEIAEHYQAGKARLDYQDLRFTWLNATSNAEQNISYWLENDNQAWVKVPNVTASNVANTTLYMYYGNPSAAYNNSLGGNQTFEFFDDFSRADSATVGNGWTELESTNGKTSILSNQLKSLTDSTIYKPFDKSSNTKISFKFKQTGGTTARVGALVLGGTTGTYVDASGFGWVYHWNSVDPYRLVLRDNFVADVSQALTLSSSAGYNYESIIFNDYSTEIRIWEGGTSKPATPTATSTAQTPTASGTNIRLGSNGVGDGTEAIIIDEFHISKYASPEPSTLSVGAEQNNTLCSGITAEQAKAGYSIAGCAGNVAPISLYAVLETSDPTLTTPGLRQWNVTHFLILINLTSPQASSLGSGQYNLTVTIPQSNINDLTFNISQVWANVTWVSGSELVFLSGSVSGGLWNKTYNSFRIGAHNVTFYANLTDGFATTTQANTTFDDSCGTLGIANGNYLLTQNVSSSATCFTIGANNVTLDGQGYWINYSQGATAGYAVNNSLGYDNITIKNLNIVQGNSLLSRAYAIYGSGMANSSVTNNTIRTSNTVDYATANNHGIFLTSSSNSNNISGNIIIITGTGYATNIASHAIFINSSNSNNISGNNLSTQKNNDYGIYLLSSNNSVLSGNTINLNGQNYEYGVFLSSSNTNTVLNNSIRTAGGQQSYGVFLSSASSNNISGNNITTGFSGGGDNSHGVYITSSSTANNISSNMIVSYCDACSTIYIDGSSNSNTFTSNNITRAGTSSYGIYVNANFNTFQNNNVSATGATSEGVYLNSANNNTFSGGSIVSASSRAYRLNGASTTNNFTNTNFTASRSIYFADATSWFNYRNDSSQNIWLRTNVSAAVREITRTLVTWSQAQMKWNDTNVSGSFVANYNLTGLLPSAKYWIYNKSAGVLTKPYALTTDAAGALSFNISLNGNTEIRVDNRYLVFDQFNVSNSSGNPAGILNTGEAYNLTVRIQETNGTQNSTVSSGSFNITIGGTNYPLVYTSSNSVWRTQTTYGNAASSLGTQSFLANISGTSSPNEIIGSLNDVNYTYYVKQLNITYSINDSAIYASETATINGTVYREPEHAASVGTPVQGSVNSGNLTGYFKPAGETSYAWQYRKPITINGSNVSLSDYQVNLTINWTSGMKNTFDDLRFTYYNSTNGIETQTPYWIENYTASTNATVWIKANFTAGNNTVYMYYGNPSAINQSNQTNVFGNWVKGYCGIKIYNGDTGGSTTWGPLGIGCVSPQCVSNNLVANNSIDFSSYPARDACKSIGGRLPTGNGGELACIYNNRGSLGTFRSFYYWSSTQATFQDYASCLNFNNGVEYNTNTCYKDTSGPYVRCVLSYASLEPSMLSVGAEQISTGPIVSTATNSSGAYSFAYTPNSSITSITSVNFTINATDTDGITNFTASPQGAITVYPQIQINITTSQSWYDIGQAINATATVFYGTSLDNSAAEVQFEVLKDGYRYPNNVTVNTSAWLSTAGSTVSYIYTFNESGKYYVKATARNTQVNSAATATAVKNYTAGRINATISLNDSVIYDNEAAQVSGMVYDWMNESWVRAPPWWNSSWQYRKMLTINGSTSVLTDYQANLTIIWASGMNSTFQDLRFTYYNSTTQAETQIPYWIEKNYTGTNATVWIKTNMTTGSNTIYMYYGNPTAAGASNGTNTFVAFDNFEGAGLLSWTNGANAETWANSDGYRKQTNTAASAPPYMKTSYINIPETNYIVHAKFYASGSVGSESRQGLVTEKISGDGWYLGTIGYNNPANSVILDTGGPNGWIGSTALGFTVAANTWYNIDMLRQPNVQKVSIRPIGSSISWTTQLTMTSLANKIAGLSGGYNTEVWYDDFFVRKYTSPEPSVLSTGSAETQSGATVYLFATGGTILSNISTNTTGGYGTAYTPPSITSIQTYTLTANATDADTLNSSTVSTQIKVYPSLNLTASRAWANATYYNKGEGIRFASALYANNSGLLQGAIGRAYNPNFSTSYIDISERGETFWNGTYEGNYTTQAGDNSGNWSIGARLEVNWETNLVNATVYINPFKIGTGTYKDSLFTTPKQNFTQAETIHIKVENTAGNPSKINATIIIRDSSGGIASTQSVQDLAVGGIQDVSYALSDNNIGLDKQLKPGYWTVTISANNTAGDWAYRAVNFFVAPDWWVADSTASAFWEYRQRITLDNSLGIERANVSVKLNGSQLSAAGAGISSMNIGSIRIIDISRNGTGANEIGGMRLNYTTNASGTFGASDYIIFNASIPENSRKSYYIYYSENSMTAPSYGTFSGPFFPASLEQPFEPSALRAYNLATSKSSYRFGETVYVNASVFSTHPAQTKINFYFLNGAGSIADDLTVYNVLDPNLDRIFESSSALPLSQAYGGYGIWAVRADVYDWLISNITPQDTKSLNFTVDEIVIPFTISQTAFDAGTPITISGYGYRAATNETAGGANYSIARDGAIINISTTNSTGNFSYTYTEKTPGAHTITISMNKTIGSATILGENSTAINVRSRADVLIQSQDTNRDPNDSPTFLVNITRNYADVSQTVDLDFAINDTNGATGYSIARKTIIVPAEGSNSTTVDWDIRGVAPQNYTIGVSANISGSVAGSNSTWFNRLNLTEALSTYNVNTFGNITLTGSVRYGGSGAVLNSEIVNLTITGPENYAYQAASNPSNYNYTFSVGTHGNYSVSVVSAGQQYKGYNTTNFTVNYTANLSILTDVTTLMANRNLTINITIRNNDNASVSGLQANITLLNSLGSEIRSLANITQNFGALENKTNQTWWLTAGASEGIYYVRARAYYTGLLAGERNYTLNITNYTANLTIALNASTIKANRVLGINITTANGDTVSTAGLQTNLTLLDAAGTPLASLLNVTQDYAARENKTNSTIWAAATTAPGTYYIRARAYLGGAKVGEANQSFEINETRNITQSIGTNASSYSGVGKSVGISAWVNRTGNVLINGTADVYIISYGGTRYEAELNDSGTWTSGTLNFTGILAQPVQARWNTENFHNGTYFAYLAFNYTDEYGNNLSLTANNTFNISPQWSATFAYVYPTVTAYNWTDTFANVTIRLNNTGNTELCDDPDECEFFVKATAVDDASRFKVFTVQTAPHDAGWTGIAGPVAVLATLDKSAYVTNFVFSGDSSTWLAGNYTFNTTLHYDGARTAGNLTYGFRILETYGNLTLAAGAGSDVNNKNFTSNSDLTFNADWSTSGANTNRQLTGWANIKYKGYPELLSQAAQNFTATSGGTPNNIAWNSGQMPAAEYDVYLWASAIGSSVPVDFVYSTNPGYIQSYTRAFRISPTKDARIISIASDRSSNYSLNEIVTVSGALWRRGNINFTGTLDINITGPSDALNMSSCDTAVSLNNSVNASFSCIWNTSVYPAGTYNVSALIIWGTDPLNRSANWTAFSITPVKSAALALSTEASSYSMNRNISSSVNITGTGNTDITGNLTLALAGAENKTLYSENAISIPVSAAAARSIPWNITNTLAGNYVLNATYAYYNASGNLTVASAAKSITIASDTNATARIFTDKQAYINSENANITFNFTAEGNNEYPGAAYDVALNGSAGTIASSSWAFLARNGTNHSAVIWNTASRPAGTYFVSLTVANSSKTWSANTTFAIQEIKSARISGLAVDRIIPSYYNIGESIAMQGGTLSAAGNVNFSGNLTVKFTDKRTLATYNTTTCRGIATPYSISSCTGSSISTAGWSVGRVYMNASFAYDNSSGQQLAVNATELQIGSTSVNATARGNDNVAKTDFFKKDSIKIYLKIRNTSGDTVSGIAAGNASSVTENGIDITSAARSGWTDAGGGEYYFTLGELALGTYAVTATVQDPYEGTSGTGSVTFVVSEHWVIFTVSSGEMSPVSNAAKNYAASDLSGSTATAVISRGSLKNVTGASGAIAVNQWLQNNNIYLVFTKGTYANIESRLPEIESGEFEKYASPSFGFPLKKDYTLSVGIDYSPKDINLLGDMQLYPGMYTFVIRNEGVQNGKTVVSVNRK